MALSQAEGTRPAHISDPSARFRRGSWLLLILCGAGLALGLALLSVDEIELRTLLYRQLKTLVMFRGQDTPWLAVCVAFGLYLVWALRSPADRPRLAALWPRDPNVAVWTAVITVLVLAFVGIGTHAFHHAHNVVLDEFFPEFQARIFRSGRLLASVPDEWQELRHAVFPLFLFHDADHQLWGSSYRPVHAAILALFSLAGLGTLTNAVLTAASVILIVGVARRLWPERRDAAILAALLLATGPQFLFTGMTGFAWSAHLCFNLLWLWLYLRDDNWGHGLAALVGFAAVGLHQINPHPLFVMPFMLALLADRRWRLAAFYATTYGAAVLTWTFWHEIAVVLSAGPGATDAAPNAGLGYIGGTASRIGIYQLLFQPLMAVNLLRLLSWQHVMIVPLIVVALRPWSSAPSTVRLLAWGCVLSMIPYVLIMPNQFYAWGFRYAHGLLGSLALIAVHGWVVLSAKDGPAAAVARRAIIAFAVLVVAVGLPLRAVQMERFVGPLAEANRHVKSLQTEVVVVDMTNLWFPYDVIRNDPDLAERPVTLSLFYLSPEQLRRVCREYSVTVVDRDDLAEFGVATVLYDKPYSERDDALRAIAHGPECRGPQG